MLALEAPSGFQGGCKTHHAEGKAKAQAEDDAIADTLVERESHHLGRVLAGWVAVYVGVG